MTDYKKRSDVCSQGFSVVVRGKRVNENYNEYHYSRGVVVVSLLEFPRNHPGKSSCCIFDTVLRLCVTRVVRVQDTEIGLQI